MKKIFNCKVPENIFDIGQLSMIDKLKLKDLQKSMSEVSDAEFIMVKDISKDTSCISSNQV